MSPKREHGKPTVEQKRAELAADPEFHDDQRREKARIKARTDRANAIIQQFRQGAKTYCAIAIWGQFESTTETDTRRGLARFFKVREQEITKLRKGEMSMSMFIALLSELRLDFTTLKNLPSLRDRAAAGYGFAIHWVATGERNPSDESLLAAESFIAVCLALRDESHRSLRDGGTITESDWESLARRIAPRLATIMEVEPNRQLVNGTELQALVERWGRYVGECRKAIPHRWIEGVTA